MEPTLNIIENGYGTPDRKTRKNPNGCATPETDVLSNHDDEIQSVEDGSQASDIINERHSWLLPFFLNIFFTCASSSVVVPSLTPYVLDIGAPVAFLPWVISSYSVGEMFGSIAIGYYYEHATKTYKTIGRGPKLSMMLCLILGVIGSAMYAMAGWVEDKNVAKCCLIVARLIQGMWTGGQQSVEQAYLSAAVHPSKRTEYTATLSTCAFLGFVIGPTIGAVLTQIDTEIFGLPVNGNNSAGIFMLVATMFMFFQTALLFDGKDDATGNVVDGDNESDDQNNNADTIQTNLEKPPFNHMGVAVCMIIFYVHYYSFAVRESITTPMVMLLYDWDPLKINVLFTGAGLMSFITALSVRYLARYVEDQSILISSLAIGFIGSTLLLDKPFGPTLPVWRFLLGFSLITIAFPLGRNAVLGIYGSVLGEVNQGRRMGIIFAISAFPRVIGPFASLELLIFVNWQTWLEFGICAVLFGTALLVALRRIGELVPLADFAKEQDERLAAKVNRLSPSHSPVPSLILCAGPAIR